MKKSLLAAGLASFAAISTTYAQDNSPARPAAGQVQNHKAAHHDQQGVTIQEALLKKLKKSNEGEIELAKLAQQHSSNAEVKALAQHLISDHQSMIQNLEKVDKSAQPASGAFKPSNENTAPGRNVAPTVHTDGSGHMALIPHEFCQLGEKACENNLMMVKELLTKYKGQDFDMAFLGQQCVAHTMTLAELKAIQSDGPQELRQLATEASTKVQEHLNAIKELSKKLEDDRKAPNS